MKVTIFPLMLLPFCLSMPAIAQTGTVQQQASTNSEAVQAQMRQLLAAAGSNHPILTPQQKADQDAIQKRVNQLNALGSDALHAGNFVSAEQFFQESVNTRNNPWVCYRLAQSLIGQGRTADAIQVYRSVIYQRQQNDGVQTTVAVSQNPTEMKSGMYLRECGTWGETEDWMRYALLLSQTGQQKEATTIYLKALPRTPMLDDQVRKTLSDTDHLSLPAFQAATHIATGLCVSQSTGDDAAMSEFIKAQQLQPDSPLTNYYYGSGWQKLSLADRAKTGSPDKARAALEKAAKLGTGDVQTQAKAELEQLR